jgi:hypothetical protein
MGLRIYGASDDLIEIEGDVREEIGSYDKDCTIQIGDKTGGLLVTMSYGKRGTACWSAEISLIDEGIPIPWPVTVCLGESCEYSAQVDIYCPADTPVKWPEEADHAQP